MESILLLCAVVIVICIVASRLSQRLGVPALLLFLALGMLFGSDGLFRIPFDNFEAAERICSVALIFIMFYGGFGTRWEAARPAAARAVVLSTLGVAVTALLTALFCHFALGFSVLESFLTGAVISSTDAASVFSILRSKKLGLRNHTASLLEVESGSNDPASYMLTVIALSLMVGGGGAIPWMIFAQVVFGLGLGAAVAGLSILVLAGSRSPTGWILFSWWRGPALLCPARRGGGTATWGLSGGHPDRKRQIPHKAALVHFFDGLTGLAQILIFFLLGLLSFPRQLPAVFLPALAIMVFLTFVARPAAVFLLLAPFRCGVRQCLLVSWAGLRGAASIVFAIMAVASGAAIGYDLFHIVFCIALLSVAVQGSLLPLAARKLDMVDSAESVSRTFNDYQDQRQLHLTRFPIGAGHPWVGRTIGECELPADALVVMLRRGSENVIPNGDTAIQAGDLMVLSTPLYEDDDGVSLREVPVAEHGDWIGRPIKELGIPAEVLIVLVRRADGTTVVPKGGTVLQQGDMLVVNEWEET
ncbi:MAG: cation:proton antiporter [Flavonifractor plautii]